MKISMHMVRKALGEQVLIDSISDGEPCITGVRCIEAELVRTTEETLNIFPDAESPGRFHLINRNDWIIISAENLGDALNVVLGVMDEYDQFETSIHDALLSDAGMGEALSLVADRIGNPMTVINTAGIVVARESGGWDDDGDSRFWSTMRQGESVSDQWITSEFEDQYGNAVQRLNGRAQTYSYRSDYPSMIGVFAFDEGGQEVVAVEAYELAKPFGPLDCQLVDLLARHIEKALPNLEDEHVETRAKLFADSLVSDTALTDSAAKRLMFPYPVGTSMCIAVVRVLARQELVQRNMLAKILGHRFPQGLVDVDDDITCMLSVEEMDAFRNENLFNVSQVAAMGVSLPFFDASAIPSRFRQAIFALGKADGRAGVFECKDFAYERIIAQLRSLDDIEGLLHPALAILKEHDRISDGCMYETLRCYLSHNCSLAQCAKALFIHKNTLLYRLRRIKEQVGEVLEDPRERQYLFISYIIAEGDFVDQGELI